MNTFETRATIQIFCLAHEAGAPCCVGFAGLKNTKLTDWLAARPVVVVLGGFQVGSPWVQEVVCQVMFPAKEGLYIHRFEQLDVFNSHTCTVNLL